MKYINEVIQEEYKEWKKGDVVLITAPTGSGKSTFVLQTLLAEAVRHKKYLVYICNRYVLKEQIIEDVERATLKAVGIERTLTDEEKKSFIVNTYQHFEKKGGFPNIVIEPEKDPDENKLSREEKYLKYRNSRHLRNDKIISADDVMYYVFDEAHYFVSDASFNRNTSYWEAASKRFLKSIAVFLTATPEPLYCFLYGFSRVYSELLKDTHEKIVSRNIDRYKLTHPGIEFEITYKDGFVSEQKTQRNIPSDNELRKILKENHAPFKEVFWHIREAIENPYKSGGLLKETDRKYTLPTDYSYIDPTYFEEIDELVNDIIRSKEKWLIFVKTIEEGVRLEEKLNARKCTATFISSSNIKKAGTRAHSEFCKLSTEGRFESKVLISTKVMDCGVSVRDSSVTNLVIDQIDKTEFIQMIGRIRVRDKERIRLYIKYISPVEVNGTRRGMESILTFLCAYSLLHNMVVDKIGMDIKGMIRLLGHEYYSEEMREEIKETSFSQKMINYIFPNPQQYLLEYAKKEEAEGKHYISITGLVYVMYSLRNYTKALNEYGDSGDPLFYMKMQLQWITKEYDRSCWYGFEKVKKDFVKYLDRVYEKSTGAGLDKQQQDSFREKCVEYVLKLSFAATPPCIAKDISDYKSGKRVPGKKIINELLTDMGIPYRVESLRPKKAEPTRWILKRID